MVLIKVDMKRSLLKQVLLKSNRRDIETLVMADQREHFDTNLFILSIKNFIIKYPVTINEFMKIQRIMKMIREELNVIEESNIEQIDPYGFENSDASGSSGDSAVGDIPFRGWEYHKLVPSEKDILMEEISLDIFNLFSLMPSIHLKNKYAMLIIHCFYHASKHSMKNFSYLL